MHSRRLFCLLVKGNVVNVNSKLTIEAGGVQSPISSERPVLEQQHGALRVFGAHPLPLFLNHVCEVSQVATFCADIERDGDCEKLKV